VSKIVTTDLCRFRLVQTQADPLEHAWLFECPGCGRWAYLDDDQWHGRVSVDHSGETSPTTGAVCTYHETHDYQAELRARIAARSLTGNSPFDPEDQPTPCEVGQPAAQPGGGRST